MPNNTENRGFASMDDNKQRDIASKGGQARFWTRKDSPAAGVSKNSLD